MVLAIAVRLPPRDPRRPAADPAPRGGALDVAGVPAIHVFRSVSAHAAEPIGIGPIHAGDGLLFAYTNPDPRLTHLMIFALAPTDTQAVAVHWYYPAYRQLGEDPEAMAILPGTTGMELGEEIRQPLRPGPVRIYALFLREPHRVLEIESLIRKVIEEPRRPVTEETRCRCREVCNPRCSCRSRHESAARVVLAWWRRWHWRDRRIRGAAPAATPARETRRFALMIGNNQPPRADLPRLRYADDDAVRWAVLFDTLGADVEVLAELDDESRQLYGGVVPPMTPPSRAAVDTAVARIAAAIAGARAGGAHVVFYFIYAGHGDVEDGKGYIALTDAHFTRDDLSERVLEAVHADTNHVIVDACRASYFLTNRGPGGERRAWQDSYFRAQRSQRRQHRLPARQLGERPQPRMGGVPGRHLLARGRSGLMGPADANGEVSSPIAS